MYQILIYFGDRELNMDDGPAYRFNSQKIKNSACYTLYALLPLTD
ncbi:MAG: hypothetical protein ACPLQO_04870 [Desulfotomaculales bacterium]